LKETLLENSHFSPAREQHVQRVLGIFSVGFLSMLLAYLGFLVWIAKRISHRFAGAVFALERHIEAASSGKVSPLVLRNSDPFKREFESMASKIDAAIEQRKDGAS
jgi:hypothetical protein